MDNVRPFPHPPADEDGFDHNPLANIEAEQAVLGSMLDDPKAIDEVAAIIDGPHYYRRQHEQIHLAIRALYTMGKPTDPIAVADELTRRQQLSTIGGAPYLWTLARMGVPWVNAAHYAELVREKAELREQDKLGRALIDGARDASPSAGQAVTLISEYLERRSARTTRTTVRELDDLLAEDDEDYDWLVPGLIERQDRVMLTGPEGGGKSTFLRQFAVCCASGIHPFTGELIAPLRVLNLDLENSERQTKRKYRPMRAAAGDRYGRTLFIQSRPEGIDLLKPEDQEWLQHLVDEVKPDLVTTGPVYKMAGGDPTEEKSAKPVALALDRIRAGGAALLIETHTPHASNGGKRPRRPYGWSGWLRWPEFGIYLGEDGEVDHWRGQRDERDWPVMLRRGGQWPWTPVSDPNEVAWGRIRQYRRDFGEYMSYRDIESALGLPKSTVARVLGKHKDEWTTLNGQPGKSDAS